MEFIEYIFYYIIELFLCTSAEFEPFRWQSETQDFQNMGEMASEYIAPVVLSQFKCHFKIYSEAFDVDV